MNSDLIFRILLGLIFVATIAIRRYYERRSAAIARTELAQDRDNPREITLLSLILTLVNLAIIVYLINPDWLAWSRLPFPDWLRWLGAALGVLGVALLLWTHRTLDKNFFGGVKLRQGHSLVTGGPYRRVRHPMYTALFLIGVGYLLLSSSWLIGLPWLTTIAVTAATRVNQEERMLAEQFGDQYRAYQSRTGRFLPRLR